MSQESTRGGQRNASLSEEQRAQTRTSLESSESPLLSRTRIGTPSQHAEAGLARREQRLTRGSDFHAILNPSSSASETSNPSATPSHNRRRTAAVQHDDTEHTSRVSSHRGASSNAPSHRQGRASASTASTHQGFPERPSSASLYPSRSSTGSQQAQYNPPAFPTPQSQGFLPSRPNLGSNTPYGLHAREGEPSTPLRDPGRSLLPEHAQGSGSTTLTGGLAVDVSQLALERTGNVPVAAGSQGAYQYMTLETDHGPVSFPVDIQAASRVADEKRRRNAGASARFRARRKEKEQANSREIDDLRQEIDDLEEEVDFYRRERDYLAPLLYNAPDRDRHFPRPVSPRRRRPVQRPVQRPVDAASFSSSGPETSQAYEELGQRAAPERHTRRRLSVGIFDEPQSGLTPIQALPPTPQNPAYPSTHRSLPQHPPIPPPEHPLHPQRHTYPQVVPLPPTTSPQDPIPRGYNRPWPPSGGPNPP